MSTIIPLSRSHLISALANTNQDPILKGLYRGQIGFLIAPPDSGKSYLCLSIAYECALPDFPLLNLRAKAESIRTLLWPIEDSLVGTVPRIDAHLARISLQRQELLQQAIGLYQSQAPICCSGQQQQSQEGKEARSALAKLIEAAKDYDLVILDTLREAMGSADEVKDDYYIRTCLETLASEANVAVLVVHHPTKEISRGKEAITSVAGSGLSSTLSKSKLHLYLDQKLDKSSGELITQLRHIKANYLPIAEQLRTPLLLKWTDASLLHDPKAIHLPTEYPELPAKSIAVEGRKKRSSRLPDEPPVIERNEAALSEQSKWLAENHSITPFGNGMLDQLQSLNSDKKDQS